MSDRGLWPSYSPFEGGEGDVLGDSTTEYREELMLHYDAKLKKRSRELRNNNTLAEVLLWNQLKGRKMLGCSFLRHRPIYKYIVDFYCPKLGLVIEIDGESHREKFASDQVRQKNLENLGLSVLRFYDRA